MNYSKIKIYDIANGPGLRVSVWFTGCNLHCEGCFNSELWDFNSGSPWTTNEEDLVIKMLSNPQISGLSILGGEPLLQDHETLLNFLKKIKRIDSESFNKEIWLWTGFYKDNLNEEQKEIVKYVDVLVDGPYIEKLNKGTHRFRGSLNQRIWKVDVLGKYEEITDEIDKNEYGSIEVTSNKIALNVHNVFQFS